MLVIEKKNQEEKIMGAKDQPQEPKRESVLNPNPNPNPNPTPNQNSISETQFLSWKRQKDAVASASKAEASRKRAEDIAAGTVQMTGRELFLHEPWVFDNTLY